MAGKESQQRCYYAGDLGPATTALVTKAMRVMDSSVSFLLQNLKHLWSWGSERGWRPHVKNVKPHRLGLGTGSDFRPRLFYLEINICLKGRQVVLIQITRKKDLFLNHRMVVTKGLEQCVRITLSVGVTVGCNRAGVWEG